MQPFFTAGFRVLKYAIPCGLVLNLRFWEETWRTSTVQVAEVRVSCYESAVQDRHCFTMLLVAPHCKQNRHFANCL